MSRAVERVVVSPLQFMDFHSLFWADDPAMHAAYSDGGTVGTWYNMTGEQDATEATNKPTWNQHDGNLGNRAAVSFDGTNDKLVSAAFTSNPSGDVTVVAVANVFDNGGTDRMWFDGIASGNRMVMHNRMSTGDFRIFQGTAVITDTSWLAGQPYLFQGLFAGDTTSELWLSGTSGGTGDIGSHTLTGITLGCDWNSANFAQFDVALVGVIEGDATTLDGWDELLMWLANYYALDALPQYTAARAAALAPAISSPDHISGLTVWFDSNDASTFDAASVSTWTNKADDVNWDKNGSALTYPHSTQINGLDVIDFNASNQSFDPPSDTDYWGSAGEWTVCASIQLDSAAAAQTIFSGDQGSNRIMYLDVNASGAVVAAHLNEAGSAFESTAGSLSTGTPHIVSGTFDGTTITAYADGVPDASPATLTGTSADFVSEPTTRAKVGQRRTTNWYGGQLGEVICYNRALSTAERLSVEGYLARKWKGGGSYTAGVGGQYGQAYRTHPIDMLSPHSYFWADGRAFQASNPTDGGTVGTWHNETGESDATQTTEADKPIYRASEPSFGGRAAIDFDGTNHYLATAAFSSNPDYTNDVSMVCIASVDVLPTTAANDILVDGIGASNRNALFVYHISDKWGIYSGTAENFGTTTVATGTGYLVRGLFNNSTGAETLAVDETVENSATNAGSQTLTGLTFGHQYTTTAGEFNGKIALVMIVEGDVSTHPAWPAFLEWARGYYRLPV